MSNGATTVGVPPGGSPPAAAPPPHVSDRYELHGALAAGGMGTVYRGWDRVLQRPVAVKLLREDLVAPGVVQRFNHEAHITGQLQHPSILPVYDMGTTADGRPFLVMKLIKGRTLEDLIRRPAGDALNALGVFEAVCQAVGYAHSKGVIHRDLKPMNIMVGSFGEVQVMDWGLAKVCGDPEATEVTPSAASIFLDPRTTAGDTKTVAGAVMGTPAYMPPEQAIGAVDLVNERSDVFGLGGILCALLTGKPVFVADNTEGTRQQAAKGKTADAFARLDACGAEREVVDLAKRCLAGEPADRPANGNAVATQVAALRRAADDRARQAELDRVKAEGRQAAAEWQAAEQRKRRKVQAALGITFTALVVGGVLALGWVRDQERARADELRDRRERQERDVFAAVEDAEARFARARAANRDPGLWGEARSAANQARRRAAADGVPAAVRKQMDALVTEIDRLDKNRRLVAALLEIQAGMGDSLLSNGDQDFPGADGRYDRALTEYGADLFRMPAADGAALLEGLGADVRVQLAAALDDWSYVKFMRRRAGQPRPPHLFDVTSRFDPDPTRNLIRRAAAGLDKAALADIARTIDPAGHPPQTINLIAVYLFQFENSPAARNDLIVFLERAYPEHPGDFQIVHNLAFYCLRDGQPEKAVAYATAGVGLRPQSAVAWFDLTWALSTLKRNPEAKRAVGHLIALAPRLAWAHVVLAKIGAEDGDWAAAEDAFRAAGRILPAYAVDRATAAAQGYRAAGKYQAAAWMQRQCLPLQTLNGEPTLAAVVTMTNLAHDLLSAGQTAEAAEVLNKLVLMNRQTPNPDERHLAAVLYRAGVDLGRQHAHGQAEGFLRACLDIRQRLTPDTWEWPATQAALGQCLLYQRKHGPAEPLLEKAYAGLVRLRDTIPEYADARVAAAARGLIRLYEETGRADRARQLRADWRREPAPPPRPRMPPPVPLPR